MRPGQAKDSLGGFTLVEVIVSITILSTSLLAVFGVLRLCSSASVTSQRMTESSLLAEKLLVETMCDKNLIFQTRTGKESIFTWQITTSSTDIENLAMVYITIQWQQQMVQKEYQLKSLLYIKPQYEGQ